MVTGNVHQAYFPCQDFWCWYCSDQILIRKYHCSQKKSRGTRFVKLLLENCGVPNNCRTKIEQYLEFLYQIDYTKWKDALKLLATNCNTKWKDALKLLLTKLETPTPNRFLVHSRYLQQSPQSFPFAPTVLAWCLAIAFEGQTPPLMIRDRSRYCGQWSQTCDIHGSNVLDISDVSRSP